MVALSKSAERIARNKPLFVPLISKYYDAFARGEKTTELRIYGQRWNEKTCYVGREVILSKGYGKKHRLDGIIIGVEVKDANTLPNHWEALMECYGRVDYDVILIHIQTPILRLL